VQATITSTRCALSVSPVLALSPFRDSQRQPETDQRQPPFSLGLPCSHSGRRSPPLRGFSWGWTQEQRGYRVHNHQHMFSRGTVSNLSASSLRALPCMPSPCAVHPRFNSRHETVRYYRWHTLMLVLSPQSGEVEFEINSPIRPSEVRFYVLRCTILLPGPSIFCVA